MATSIVLSIFLSFGIIGLFWWALCTDKQEQFNKYLKVGDKVDYYNGNDRRVYTLVSNGEIFCEIKSESGCITKVQRTDLYPNWNYKYSR